MVQAKLLYNCYKISILSLINILYMAKMADINSFIENLVANILVMNYTSFSGAYIDFSGRGG